MAPLTEENIVQFQEIQPSINSHLTLYMLETFGASIKLISQYSPQDLRVQLWTNTLNKFNSEGNWHSLDLPYQSQESKDISIFKGSFIPTSEGNYQFTYRIGLKQQPGQWQWVGKFGENGYLSVEAPSSQMIWTQGPSYVEILPRVYVGNFIAASNATELRFDAVLNLAGEFLLNFPVNTGITYKQLSVLDGAQHPIPDEVLGEAIFWIDKQLLQGKKKVLVNCRAGIGRSGSVGLAYCFYKYPQWSYRQTLDYVWSKKADIYPHKQLQKSLERLFPRGKSDVMN